MKKVIALLGLIGLINITTVAQTATDSLYIVTYTTGPAWDFAKTPN